jgi:hypothetical protein
MRAEVRGKSLNGIRQICDAAKDFHGALWVFTGTPEFFDHTRGVKGLQPLHDRIEFLRHGEMASLRQPQLELKPFDAARLKDVAQRLLSIFPSPDRLSLERRVTPVYIERLIASVTQGFAGDVGVVPRQFLRRFVDVLDLATDHPDFDPNRELAFEPKEPNEAEKRLAKKQPPYDSEPDDEKGYPVTSVEF